VDQQLKNIHEEAKIEKYYSELKIQLDLIQSKIEENKKNELNLYKDQIKALIEEDIASRYYLAKGSVEVGFKNDQDIKKASEVLLNQVQYKKILNHQ
jgi:carboxyl-terminal processing protease